MMTKEQLEWLRANVSIIDGKHIHLTAFLDFQARFSLEINEAWDIIEEYICSTSSS